MRGLIVLIVLLVSFSGFCQERRAQSLIDKDKRYDAYELLVKAISKDSLASSEHFILASLFIDQQFEFYNIDSAYDHVILARQNFAELDEKTQSRLAGNGYNLQVYDTLQKHIETAGFKRAKSLGREEDYITFLELFQAADQLDSAVILRDADAFRKASVDHTYDAYQNFFERYPKAREAGEAKKRYHKLLYEARTTSGKLADYKQFLQDYPDTWHRKETEWHIFKIMTGKNTIQAYGQFINEFPESYWLNQAKRYAYNLGNEEEKSKILDSWGFSSAARDSLKSLTRLSNELLLLTHNGSDFEVIKAEGDVLLGNIPNLASINKCEDIDQLLLLLEPGNNRLITIEGKTVIPGQFQSYSKVSDGFIKLHFSNGEEIIHHDGTATTGKKYTRATMAGGFILFEDQDKWGLESITGIPMADPMFDTVFQFSTHLIFSQSGQWGVKSIQDFFPLLDQEKLIFELPYDSLAPIRNNELFMQIGDKTGLLSSDLEIIVPLGEARLELLEKGYFLETNDSILDSRLAKVWYSDLRSNDQWTIGFRLKGTDLYYQGRKITEVTAADLLGRSAVIVRNDKKSFCYFDPKARIQLNEGDEIKPIRKMGENSVVRHYLLTDQGGQQSVINEQGKRLKIPRFDRLIDLGEDYMIFSVKGFVYNILDYKGKVVLKNVDGATSLDSGYISYLANGKFGLLNIRNKTLIEAKYDKPLRRYDSQRFIIEEEGKLGLIDRFDSLYIDTKYEEIHPINDSIGVLKANFRWTFWNVKKGEIMLDNVSDYWEYTTDTGTYFKIFKGIGYGMWQPAKGMILNSTYDELSLKASEEELIFIAEKWVEEADLVILLYYDRKGDLLRKSVLSTRQYNLLQCQPGY